jgi:HEAT repeat protein
MGSSDPDERLRGIERVAGVHAPEALALLVRAAKPTIVGAAEPRAPLDGVARRDPRALLVAVRGLAGFTDQEQARTALASIVGAPTQSFETRVAGTPSLDPSADDAEGAARVLLARQEAAIALAESSYPLALESLIALARSVGPGQSPSLDALAIHPPPSALLGGVVLTTPATIALAITVGDLRSLEAIEGAMNASDPSLRAAALAALGAAGDSRIADAARAALHDKEPRVRLAAADALVRLGTPDAARVVEALIADDATSLDSLGLAQLVQGEGLTKAVAARAVASANLDLRTAAIAALGRQTTPLAVTALTALLADPSMQGDATCAIARSPSAAAMRAIEAMADNDSLRRLAARAYLVRRLLRGDQSVRLDSLLKRLVASGDGRDRAIATEALVAFGVQPVSMGVQDADPRVRRAAAMGAIAQWSAATRRAVLARWAAETDEVTKQVLALGFSEGDPERVAPSADLLGRIRAGEADAPVASLALAQRDEPQYLAEVDALLQSHDPVLRAHAARGLGTSAVRDAVGRLARGYAMEGDVESRRALIGSLSQRAGEEAAAPSRRETLELAARLDPDRIVRWTAERALSGKANNRRQEVRDVAWLRLLPATGASLPKDMTAALVVTGGVALPIAFDDDGYALVPSVPPGGAQLRLASRVPPYQASDP